MYKCVYVNLFVNVYVNDFLKHLLNVYAYVYYIQNGLSALHFASKNGDVDILKQLLKYGACVNAVDNVSYCILYIYNL